MSQSQYRIAHKRIDSVGDRADVNKLQKDLEASGSQVGQVRQEGYIYAGDLENRIKRALRQVLQSKSIIEQAIAEEKETLLKKSQQVEVIVDQAEDDDEAAISAINNLKSEIRKSDERIQEITKPIRDVIDAIRREINEIKEAIDIIDDITFTIDDDENLVLATESTWEDGKDKLSGHLFLTDQRLIFEQKEKTGKFLGLFGGKVEHEVEWSAPVSAVVSVNSKDAGMMGRKEMLMIGTTGENDAPKSITVQLKGGADNEIWQKLIQEAKANTLVSIHNVEDEPEEEEPSISTGGEGNTIRHDKDDPYQSTQMLAREYTEKPEILGDNITVGAVSRGSGAVSGANLSPEEIAKLPFKERVKISQSTVPLENRVPITVDTASELIEVGILKNSDTAIRSIVILEDDTLLWIDLPYSLYRADPVTTETLYRVGLVEDRKNKNERQSTGDLFLIPGKNEVFVGISDWRDEVTILKWLDVTTGEERRRKTIDGLYLDMRLSGDGSRITGNSQSGIVHVWDVETLEVVNTFDWHTQKGTAVALNHDGTRLAASSEDKTTVVWDVAESKVLLSMSTMHVVSSLTLNSDGTKLGVLVDADGSDADNILIWDVDNQKIIVPEMKKASLAQIAFNRDDSILISTGYGSDTLTLWDAETGGVVSQPSITGGTGVAFNADGTRLANGGRNWIYILETAAEAKASSATGVLDTPITVDEIANLMKHSELNGHNSNINAASFAPDNRRLATGGDDRAVIIWDTFAGTEVTRLPQEGRVRDVEFSGDGRWLAVSTEITYSSRKVALWNAETYELVGTKTSSSYFVAFSPDSSLLASGATIFNVEDLTTHHRFNQPSPQNDSAFSDDGRYFLVAIGGDMGYANRVDNRIRLYDLESLTEVEIEYENNAKVQEFGDWVLHAEISANGQIIMGATDHGGMKMIDIEKPGIVASFSGVRSLILSSDEAYLVMGKRDNTLSFVSTENYQVVHEIETGQENLSRVAISPNNAMIASISNNKSIRIWGLPVESKETVEPLVFEVEEEVQSFTSTMASLIDGHPEKVMPRAPELVLAEPEFTDEAGAGVLSILQASDEAATEAYKAYTDDNDLLLDFVEAMFNSNSETRYKVLQTLILAKRKSSQNNIRDMYAEIVTRTIQILRHDSDNAVRFAAFDLLKLFKHGDLNDLVFSTEIVTQGNTNAMTVITNLMTLIVIDDDAPLKLRGMAARYNVDSYYKGTFPYLIFMAINAEDENLQAFAAVYAFRTDKKEMKSRIDEMMPKLLRAFSITEIPLQEVTGALWSYKNDPQVKPLVLARLETANDADAKVLNRMLEHIKD